MSTLYVRPQRQRKLVLSSRETDNYVYGYFSSVMEDKQTAIIKLFKLYDRGINIQLEYKALSFMTEGNRLCGSLGEALNLVWQLADFSNKQQLPQSPPVIQVKRFWRNRDFPRSPEKEGHELI